MPNAKLRCTFCRDYFTRDDFFRPGFCSEDCFLAQQQKARDKRSRKERNRNQFHRDHKGKSLPALDRRRIRKRDRDRCRRCGTGFDLHVHHIIYRSQGGPDEDSNLITLCQSCHDKVHSDKRKYQHVCLAYIWMLYVGGRQMTLIELENAA